MAAATDSVAIFAEGTFEEQVIELANYIALSRPEAERASYIQSVQESLQVGEGQTPIAQDEGRRRQVFSNVLGDVTGLGEGSEREIEGFFNLLYAHVLTLWPVESPETKEHVSKLLQVIVASQADSNIKYRILSNLFNALPRTSELRLSVYKTLLDLASSRDELDVLQLSREDVQKWLEEWAVSPSDKTAFLKTLVDVFAKAGDAGTSYHYKVSWVRSIDAFSPEAHSAAIDLIAASLSSSTIFDFDSLFKIDAIVAQKDHELFQLLQIFVNNGVEELKAWQASHPGAAENYALDYTQLERKMRLLSLASLGFQNIGSDLPYSKIASALQVDPSEVEKWVIDVIRVQLLSGKLSQTTQTLHVVRASSRTFEREQWELLEKRLSAWRAGLEGVLEVVENSKKRTGPMPLTAAPEPQEEQTEKTGELAAVPEAQVAA
ncbi:hypothetical protein EWM64_g1301 [Hericium alpestre]|uniref:Eukaryotic translation initiation factor 3 subunit M n=1 Tax=Hericium alpestre TaxID=135208 RepID=A0A4Z0A7I8_9AGAM|nr:hypothetical protein EWM64_g1301 [Hericium alpestre]